METFYFLDAEQIGMTYEPAVYPPFLNSLYSSRSFLPSSQNYCQYDTDFLVSSMKNKGRLVLRPLARIRDSCCK